VAGAGLSEAKEAPGFRSCLAPTPATLKLSSNKALSGTGTLGHDRIDFDSDTDSDPDSDPDSNGRRSLLPQNLTGTSAVGNAGLAEQVLPAVEHFGCPADCSTFRLGEEPPESLPAGKLDDDYLRGGDDQGPRTPNAGVAPGRRNIPGAVLQPESAAVLSSPPQLNRFFARTNRGTVISRQTDAYDKKFNANSPAKYRGEHQYRHGTCYPFIDDQSVDDARQTERGREYAP